jgi:hypothetical protein
MLMLEPEACVSGEPVSLGRPFDRLAMGGDILADLAE